MKVQRDTRLLLLIGIVSVAFPIHAASDPAVYEPGVDPGVGFNLISWWNYGGSGASIWESAVQSIHDAGFDEVSISPVRFYTPGSGSIASSSSQGPELSHVAAGVARAKSLGMRVTVNPFVEPVGFSAWRGTYNPTPGSGEWSTFWSDYQGYLVEVAQMAETNGADSMTVGTELRAITQNSGNNAQWGSVISAVDAEFSGTLGYAANWDNYQDANLTSTIWENSAIDFIGIDAYFTNLLNNAQADASGSYPNQSFLGQVESAWNSKLDSEILPYASARKSGSGMPVEFTEVGYLPYNRTTVTPQNSSGGLDSDEQNMAFEGLMRALDGRAGEFSAAHIWNWGMPGTGGNLWDMGVGGGEPQASNVQTTQWLSGFVSNPQIDPLPAGATTVLYSFESGLDGFYYPNYESEPASGLSQASGTGATDGSASLRIRKPTQAWTWDARVDMNGEALQALQDALADGDADYVLELDVTYVADDLPADLTYLDLHISIETDLDGWNQVYPLAVITGPTDQTVALEVPLGDFNLSPGINSASLHLGFQGTFSGEALTYIDRIALTDITAIAGDFDNDSDVDLHDLGLWQRGETPNPWSEWDLEAWEGSYGIGSQPLVAVVAVPEPVFSPTAVFTVAALGLGFFYRIERPSA